jgi:hypothetical protein
MVIKKLSEKELQLLYEVENDFIDKGFTKNKCPRCGGELKFEGSEVSHRISCQKNCGLVYSVRGI